MNEQEFYKILISNLHHPPTACQESLFRIFINFIKSEDKNKLMLLKGYAGTGKTTLLSTIIKSLPAVNFKYVLLTPTGRAAKVLAGYTGMPAYTIHKGIYSRTAEADGSSYFKLKKNKYTRTIFVVDEASMIATDYNEFSNSGSLFHDLFDYVYSGTECYLLLSGDDAQLPPVGSDVSNALSESFIQDAFGPVIFAGTLTEVVRQSIHSGILENATQIRGKIFSGHYNPPYFTGNRFKDFKGINGIDLEDEINTSYSKCGVENTIVLCRSNKRANEYNMHIRNRILFRTEDVESEDLLMVVKNNYHWLDDKSKAGFIANGDTLEVLTVRSKEEKFGFRYLNIAVRLIDYPDEKDVEVKILMDTINSPNANLGSAESKKLYEMVVESHSGIADKFKRFLAVRNDPYLNALQVKFAYAVTCHKSQGGQWRRVFVDQGYITEEMLNKEYLRWIYTAVTRATEKLYLINFKEQFFQEP